MLTYLIRITLNLMRLWLTVNRNIAKLKIMKHHRQNIPMKMIQKRHEQAKLLQFPLEFFKYVSYIG